MDASKTPMGRVGSRFPAAALAAAAGLAILLAGLPGAPPALANGGPFTIKYPEGDPSAKGVLGRIDPSLKPARETRLKVLEENLKIAFTPDGKYDSGQADPLASVSAAYRIENPTDKEVVVDFGFPILRGVYAHRGMALYPDVHSAFAAAEAGKGEEQLSSHLITNSAIYGIIRARAREAIDKAVAKDPGLAALVEAVQKLRGEIAYSGRQADLERQVQAIQKERSVLRDAARKALAEHATGKMKWNERDAALLVEYASLDFGKNQVGAKDRSPFYAWLGEQPRSEGSNLGPLGAIGEQKATQFFAQLASGFDKEAAAAYEAIFSAWGGDVRERALDMKTGELRPREVTVSKEDLARTSANYNSTAGSDPTVYARVDYLDSNASIPDEAKASCRSILKNLPVTFTFSPMNLLYYQAKFPAKSTRTLVVSYSQYAFRDTKDAETFQLAYVVHPASLWDSFGTINLEVAVPEGIPVRASVKCEKAGTEKRAPSTRRGGSEATSCDIYRGTVDSKTGEIYVAVDSAAWRKAHAPKAAQEAIE